MSSPRYCHSREGGGNVIPDLIGDPGIIKLDSRLRGNDPRRSTLAKPTSRTTKLPSEIESQKRSV